MKFNGNYIVLDLRDILLVQSHSPQPITGLTNQQIETIKYLFKESLPVMIKYRYKSGNTIYEEVGFSLIHKSENSNQRFIDLKTTSNVSFSFSKNDDIYVFNYFISSN